MKIILLAVALFSATAIANDTKNKNINNEEAKAVTACISAMKVLESKDKVQKRAKPTESCSFNTRKKEYWYCVEKRLKNDESFPFATNQCESIDPKR